MVEPVKESLSSPSSSLATSSPDTFLAEPSPSEAFSPISLVVDTDTGSDDAVALLMAARLPGVAVRAVTTVYGNIGVDQATRNALLSLDIAGRSDIPVHQGISQPMLRMQEDAEFVHGSDGMSNVPLGQPSRAADPGHAVDVLRDIARNEPGQHTLVTLGPLTNIAAALLIDPDFLQAFRRVVIMGGAFDGVGNVGRAGEFNIWSDPEAAKIVVDASGSVTFVGWDISRRHAVITAEEQDQLRALGRVGQFAVAINQAVNDYAIAQTGLAGYDLPDPIAMAVAINPSVATELRWANIDIGMDDAGRGGTFIDHYGHLVEGDERQRSNCQFVAVANEALFKRMLWKACAD